MLIIGVCSMWLFGRVLFGLVVLLVEVLVGDCIGMVGVVCWVGVWVGVIIICGWVWIML